LYPNRLEAAWIGGFGGAERATSQTAYVLQGQANQALATQYITLNVETAFSCVHDSN